MFILTNNEISYTASQIEALKEIPAGNWLLKFNPLKGYYLESTQSFKFPPKIYGDAEKLATRYLNTFNSINGNIGILLSGTKGTGKSVTAKLTANNSGLAVIIITEAFYDDGFKSFLSNISQMCVVLVDEFEKVYYNNDLQNNFLSILDGVFEGKKMFIFTSNEKDRVNQYMLNRPGRIHYLGEYDTLSDDIIEDVINDNLKNLENKEGLISVLNVLGTITMDILISLIREMNMYKETANESIKYLNLKPESNMYDVEIFQGKERLGSTSIHSHPLMDEELSVEFLIDDIRKYTRPIIEREEDCTVVPKCDEQSIYPAVSNEVDLKSQKQSEWIYFTINISDSKITQIDKKIIIESDNNMRFIFTKKKSYYFTF